ncbi:MAG TPA: hypothetical protein VG326_21480 [Tepidisphaeraceae bacterium]|jgi:hypothetical protein|nr:hypothetical protein [Tepidisphaeraceae bacterium]
MRQPKDNDLPTFRELRDCDRLLKALRRQFAAAHLHEDMEAIQTFGEQIQNVERWAEAVAQEIGE